MFPCMYEQQDAVLRQATSDILRRTPGFELQSPSKLLFQNSRETASPPDPSFRDIVDEIHGKEELAYANDFYKFFVLPIVYNVSLPSLPPLVFAFRHNDIFSNGAAAAGVATCRRLARLSLLVFHPHVRLLRQAPEVPRVRCASSFPFYCLTNEPCPS